MFSSFVLKIIAVICMTCDHISVSVLHKFSYLNVIRQNCFSYFRFSNNRRIYAYKGFEEIF